MPTWGLGLDEIVRRAAELLRRAEEAGRGSFPIPVYAVPPIRLSSRPATFSAKPICGRLMPVRIEEVLHQMAEHKLGRLPVLEKWSWPASSAEKLPEQRR